MTSWASFETVQYHKWASNSWSALLFVAADASSSPLGRSVRKSWYCCSVSAAKGTYLCHFWLMWPPWGSGLLCRDHGDAQKPIPSNVYKFSERPCGSPASLSLLSAHGTGSSCPWRVVHVLHQVSNFARARFSHMSLNWPVALKRASFICPREFLYLDSFNWSSIL